MNFLKSKILNLKSHSGYAILFTMIIISIIMTIAIGISNSVYKQLILSSTANNSQIAFYQADTAGECALFYASALGSTLGNGSTITCGVNLSGQPVNLQISSNGIDKYLIAPIAQPQEPCFRIEVDKSVPSATKIMAHGYNICNPNFSGRLERGIEINF